MEWCTDVKFRIKFTYLIWKFADQDLWHMFGIFLILRLRLRSTAEGRSFSEPNIRLRPKVKIGPTVQHCILESANYIYSGYGTWICLMFYWIQELLSYFVLRLCATSRIERTKTNIWAKCSGTRQTLTISQCIFYRNYSVRARYQFGLDKWTLHWIKKAAK